MCTSITRSGRACKNGTSCPVHSLGPECPICLNATTRTRSTQRLKCGHVFHRTCIQQWRDTGAPTCPTCRAIINPTKYKVTLTIENTETQVSNTVPLFDASIIALFNGLGTNNLQSDHTEIQIDLFEERDILHFLDDLQIRLSHVDPLVFDTERAAVR